MEETNVREEKYAEEERRRKLCSGEGKTEGEREKTEKSRHETRRKKHETRRKIKRKNS